MKKRNGMNDQFTISNRKFKIERNGENEKIVLTAFAAQRNGLTQEPIMSDLLEPNKSIDAWMSYMLESIP